MLQYQLKHVLYAPLINVLTSRATQINLMGERKCNAATVSRTCSVH
ncbi:hypothetical protein VCRA2117O380_170079 [Vibrio crassostreae]|nr:hypothetical protein VCRA2117O380_170079 [Vibrio crassostreae]CAK1998738.1 hypothetical protein VCRA2119O381_330022 [Vibrio crassostreae]CAK4029873.1 hypothetical protein VCRA2130O400_960014 [Vibrio crassostreae]